MKFDISVQNGTILDGTGHQGFPADLLIKDARIAAVDRTQSPHEAHQVINASQRIVSPGFIDVHTHADFIFASPRHHQLLEPFVRQGVTTMVTGNCGVSPAPMNSDCIDQFSAYWDCILPGEGLGWGWRTMSEFLHHIETLRPVLNMSQLVGHGTVRLDVLGYNRRSPTAGELETMRRHVRQSIEEGAAGLSFGLGYVPGIWADTAELIHVARGLPPNGHITVHLRGQTRFFDKAVEEMISVAEAAGASLQRSHFVPFKETYTEQFFSAYQLTESARARGMNIGYDLLPYAVASTTIFMLYPPWMLEGGLPAFFTRLGRREIRDRLIDEFKHRKPEWPQWKSGTWCDFEWDEEAGWGDYRFYGFRKKEHLAYEGLNLEAIAEDMSRNPFEALFDLTVAESGRLYYTSGSHDDEGFDMAMGMFLQLPHMSFMTDAVGIGRQAKHPSHYGTFPRFLARHARDWATFPLAEAIRKCTSLPAHQLGIKDRGVIREGAYADLVIFDPDTVEDMASFAAPYRYPQGIETVLINGAPVWHNGEYLGANERPGMVLRNP
ncbi:MAG: hypothetical protein C4520_13590 [Candidatus Abyssobacteria bacterium SURF_5]|uniref:Amidohydrolase 3 domain-containing protein n=1 Tax=Abyssobacteria bacterium (strain SURF_5) TaxID=2093360 RepID=A0A3A4NI99_ABYX5|nr:MAG: hypothetical protein C4520_13590 [Candidatus Abyssubacteria bacterium SURF_5]